MRVAVAVCLLLLQASGRSTIFQQPGMFGEIIVEEDQRGMRYLLFEANGDQQSAVKPGDPDHLEFEYTRMALATLAVVPEPRRILVLGLGGGTLPMFFHRHFPRAEIDVAEIDPAVAMVARRFFGYAEDPLLQTRLGDGREIIERSTRSYDLIFLDAYGSDDVPPHLATAEFLQAVKRRLAPGGVVSANITSAPGNPVYHRMVATYRELFPEVQLLRAGATENRIVLAVLEPGRLSREKLLAQAAAVKEAQRLRFDLAEMMDAGWLPEEEAGKKAKPLRDAKGSPPARPAPQSPPPPRPQLQPQPAAPAP